MRTLILSVAVAVAALIPVAASAQTPATNASSDQTFLDFQVEQAVKVKAAVAPAYPDHLRAAHIAGEVIVQFVVDESGNAQMNTFKVLKSNDNAFSESVRRTVSIMTFFPAEVGGKKVRQLVQVPFKFVAK